jgi:hypothetical protein
MASPDPEGMGLLAKVIAAATAVVVPVWGARTWLDKRFDKKVEKDDFKEFMARFDKHVEHDQQIQAKLFDKCDEIKDILIERLK